MRPNALRRLTAKAVLWSVVTRWGNRLLTLLILVVLTRELAPEDFGLVALAAVFVNFLALLRDLGFSQALIQRENLESPHIQAAFWTSTAAGALMGGTLWLSAGLIGSAFNEPRLSSVLQWLSLGLLINALRTVPTALLHRDLLFKQEAVRSLAGVCTGGVVAIVLAVSGAGVWALVAQALVESTVGAAASWLVIRWRPSFSFSVRHLRELVGFSSVVTFRQLTAHAVRHADDLLIGAFLGATALGFYTVAYRILRLVVELCVTVLTRVTLPTFSKLTSEPARLARAYFSGLQLTTATTAAAFCGLAAVAPVLIPVVFGEQWSPSIPLMTLLAIGGLVTPALSLNSSVLLAVGRLRKSVILGIVDAVVTVTAFTLAVQFGLVAVAIAYIVRGLVQLPISVLAVRPEVAGHNGRITPVLWTLSVGAVMGALVFVLQWNLQGVGAPPALNLALSIVTGALVYAGGMWVFCKPTVKQLWGWTTAAFSTNRSSTSSVEANASLVQESA